MDIDDIRLTEEEISGIAKIFPEGVTGRVGMNVANAATDKAKDRIIAWGEEWCDVHSRNANIPTYNRRRCCEQCWQALTEMVKK